MLTNGRIALGGTNSSGVRGGRIGNTSQFGLADFFGQTFLLGSFAFLSFGLAATRLLNTAFTFGFGFAFLFFGQAFGFRASFFFSYAFFFGDAFLFRNTLFFFKLALLGQLDFGFFGGNFFRRRSGRLGLGSRLGFRF